MELDAERLREVKSWVEKEIRRIEMNRANAPIWSASLGDISTLKSKTVPDLLAGPTAQVRKAVIELETSVKKADEKHAQAEAQRQDRLSQAKVKTESLQRWLEDLT